MTAHTAASSAYRAPTDADFSTLTILLLKGVLYRDAGKPLWRALLDFQGRVRDYVAVLGLELVLDDDEGYALLRPKSDVSAEGLPELLPSHALPLPAALFLARLRKALADFDVRGGGRRLVLTQAELGVLLRPYLAPSGDEASLRMHVQAHIDHLVEIGFLRPLASQTAPAAYEVQRVMRAIVDPFWLIALERRVASAGATPPATRWR